ncbi:hypothetical protein HYT52_00465 [Candidatus Woesearchaeota archaeon]|nr:hypothetical protein [Candidatus Woesearchaeota archaeon]
MRVSLDEFLENEDLFGYGTKEIGSTLIQQPWDNKEGFRLYHRDILVSSTIAPLSYACLSIVKKKGTLEASRLTAYTRYEWEIHPEDFQRFVEDFQSFMRLGIIQQETRKTRILQREEQWLSLGNTEEYNLEFPAIKREEKKEGHFATLAWGMASTITHAPAQDIQLLHSYGAELKHDYRQLYLQNLLSQPVLLMT